MDLLPPRRDGVQAFSYLTAFTWWRVWINSVEHLVTEVTAWVGHWNNDQKPFVWHAAADDVLAEVNGDEHAVPNHLRDGSPGCIVGTRQEGRVSSAANWQIWLRV
jgi:hypothetical protein